MRYDITGDSKAVQRDIGSLGPKLQRRVQTRAVNYAASRMATAAAREIAKDTGIGTRVVRKRLKILKATRTKLRATVIALLAGVRSGDLGKPRQLKKGAKAGKHTFKGAFVAAMPNGHTGVFERKADSSHKGKPLRKVKSGKHVGKTYRPELPIRETTVPLQPAAGRILDRIFNTQAGRWWKQEFERLAQVELDKRARR